MKIMGVDYGDRRTGIAITDATCFLASAAGVIEEWDMNRLAHSLFDKANELKAEKIVLGFPLNMNGTQGPRAEKTKALKEILENEYKMEVVLWDERCTTVSAHNIMNTTNTRGKKRKATVDTLSAAIILQSYIDGIKK